MSIKSIGKGVRCWVAFAGLVLGGLCLTGCRTESPHQQFAEVPPGIVAASPATATTAAPGAAVGAAPAGQAPVTAAATSTSPEPETLRVGDSLTVIFSDMQTPIAPFEEKIKEDGTITLTLNQTFKADGKTRGALEKEIRDRYVPEYYKYMTVTVKLLESTRWYYVDGEVRAPSRQIYNSRTTVSKAIASAGGFTDFGNKRKVRLTRVDGRTQTVNCVKALENPTLDPEVYPGDKIHVPRRILW